MRHIRIEHNPAWHPRNVIGSRYVFRNTATGRRLNDVTGYSLESDATQPIMVGVDGKTKMFAERIELHFEDGSSEKVLAINGLKETEPEWMKTAPNT